MIDYLVHCAAFSVIGAATYLGLAGAPARWRFRLTMVMLGICAMPWPIIPTISTSYPVPDWQAYLAPTIVPANASPPVSTGVMSAGDGLLIPWLTLLTLVGMGAVVWIVISNTRHLMRLKRQSRLDVNRSASVGLNVRVVAQSNIAASSGFLTPTIWIGQHHIDSGTDRDVLAHEAQHVRSGDTRWIWVIAMVRCLLWWNPLAWAWAHLAVREMEFSCDEAVALQIGSARYERTLASVGLHRAASTMNAMASHGLSVTNRIRNLKRKTMIKTHHRILPVLALALAPLVLIANTDPIGLSIYNDERGHFLETDGTRLNRVLETLSHDISNPYGIVVHPDLRTDETIFKLDLASSDWASLLTDTFDALNVRYRQSGPDFHVWKDGEFDDIDWSGAERDRAADLSGQIGATLTVTMNQQTRQLDDILLTPNNWTGVQVANYRFNLMARELPDETVRIELAIMSVDDLTTLVANPVLVTGYGSRGRIQLGTNNRHGPMEIEVSPVRL